MPTIDERIDGYQKQIERIEEKAKALKEKQKALKARSRARANADERRARNHRLVLIGADVEAKFGKLVDREAFNAWLETQRNWAKGFEGKGCQYQVKMSPPKRVYYQAKMSPLHPPIGTCRTAPAL